MKFAREVQELMAAYPGREFRMAQIIRYVSPAKPLDLKERRAIRKAVYRVLEALSEAGCILSRPPAVRRGGYAVYRWKSET